MRPLCAVCGRKVDELRWWRDPIENGWVYEARCHGQTQRQVVRDADLIHGRLELPANFTPGVTFRREVPGHVRSAPSPLSR